VSVSLKDRASFSTGARHRETSQIPRWYISGVLRAGIAELAIS